MIRGKIYKKEGFPSKTKAKEAENEERYRVTHIEPMEPQKQVLLFSTVSCDYINEDSKKIIIKRTLINRKFLYLICFKIFFKQIPLLKK